MKAITYQELQQYILSNAENNIFHHSYGLEEKLTNFWVNPIPAQPLELPEITADIPYMELFGYNNVLRSMTGGGGEFRYEFSRYEQAPGDVADAEIARRASKLKQDEI